MTEWQAIRLERNLGKYAREWDRLNDELYDGHPLFDSRFINALLGCFGTGTEHLLVCTEKDRTIGMTILKARRFGIWQSYLPSQLQVAPVLLSDATLLSKIFDALPNFSWQVSFLCQDPHFTPFSAPQLRRANTTYTPHAVTMQIASSLTFEKYWNNRSKSLRKNIRRYKSRADKDHGSVGVEKIIGKKSIRDAIDRYGRLESSGWKGQQGTAVHIDNDQGAFYCQVLENFAETDQACVYEYYIGGRLAASRLLIRNSEMAIILKTAYDESNRKYAPGRVLLYEVLRRELNDYPEQRTVEFYTDATTDQLQWSTKERSICHVSLFRNRFYLNLSNLLSLRHHFKKIYPRSKLNKSSEAIDS